MLKCRLLPSKTPLLDRWGGLWRGAEGDETEAGVVDFLNLIPPPRLQTLASLGLDPPLLSRRGVFDVGSLHFKTMIFNELQRRHYKRSEGTALNEVRSFASLRMTGYVSVGNPPPRRARIASLICLGSPPVQEGSLCN
jgi:hypothetical protein